MTKLGPFSDAKSGEQYFDLRSERNAQISDRRFLVKPNPRHGLAGLPNDENRR